MKGTTSGLALGVITALVMLFVGIFMIDKIAGIGESSYYDYTYTTMTNTTSQVANKTQTASYSFSLGSFASISGKTPEKTITVYVENKSADVTANVTLNGKLLGTFPLNGVTGHTFTNVDFVESAVNNITVGTDASDTATNVKNVTVKYPSGKEYTSFGSIFGNLTTNTRTIYDVLILVIIIVALGVAIAVLRGFSGGTSVSI